MLPEELQKLVHEAGVYGSGLQGILLDAALRKLLAARGGGMLKITNVREDNGKHTLVIEFVETK